MNDHTTRQQVALVTGANKGIGRAAAELSDARSAAAERFGAAVSAELVELAMPHAQVSARVSQTEDPDGLPVGDRQLSATADGVDDVHFHPVEPRQVRVSLGWGL